MHENVIYDLYYRDGKPPPPLDDKMFSMRDFILKHPLAVPTEQFLEQLVNIHTQKLVHECGNFEEMEEDKESHELAPDIPPDNEKK